MMIHDFGTGICHILEKIAGKFPPQAGRAAWNRPDPLKSRCSAEVHNVEIRLHHQILSMGIKNLRPKFTSEKMVEFELDSCLIEQSVDEYAPSMQHQSVCKQVGPKCDM